MLYLHIRKCVKLDFQGFITFMKKPFFSRPARDVFIAACFFLVCGFLVFAIITSYHHYKTEPPYVNPDKYPVNGIDISSHNGDIDFRKVAQDGISFVIIKASEGTDFTDSKFRTNYQEAKKAGLKTGAYHFFRFDKDGVEQALNFVRTVGSRKPELGLVIDVEKAGNPDTVPPDVVKKRLFTMVDYLNLLGYRVMFYTNFNGYYDFISDMFPGYPLWICRFKENPINAEWTFWQHNHHGQVAGIQGDVDLDVFCGSRDEWQSFLQGDLWPYNNDSRQ